MSQGESISSSTTSATEKVPIENLRQHLPLLLAAPVVKGFGRGSKLLGIPTANLDMAQVGALVDQLPTGIYYGWAFLRDQVFKAVASIGWNPYFHNKIKTVEPHLIHEFEDDFYGEELRFLICGYVRPEKSFPSLDALVEAIRNDIEVASKVLEDEDCCAYREWKLEWTKSATNGGEK